MELRIAGMLLTRDSLLLHKEFCLRDTDGRAFFKSIQTILLRQLYVLFILVLYLHYEWKLYY